MTRRVAPLMVLLLALHAKARAEPIIVSIDAGNAREPISRYVYGQFIEHIGGIINHGIWAEMLDDRKFYEPITSPPLPNASPRGRFAPRRWTPIGPDDCVLMDGHRPYAGDHSPLVKLDGAAPRGIRQAGLTVRKGRSYTGRVVLAGDPGVRVAVSLTWGANVGERQTVEVDRLRPEYATVALRFVAQADSDDGGLEITGRGRRSFHIGAVSFMPADNAEGFRPEVIAALKQLRSGVYRFPGGNFGRRTSGATPSATGTGARRPWTRPGTRSSRTTSARTSS